MPDDIESFLDRSLVGLGKRVLAMTDDWTDISRWAQRYADQRLADQLRLRADRLTQDALPELVAGLHTPRGVELRDVGSARSPWDAALRDAA